MLPRSPGEIQHQIDMMRNDSLLVHFVKTRFESIKKMSVADHKTLFNKVMSAILSLNDVLNIFDQSKLQFDLRWRPSIRGGSFARKGSDGFKTMVLDEFLRFPAPAESELNEIARYVEIDAVDSICRLDKETINLLATCRDYEHFERCLIFDLKGWERDLPDCLREIAYKGKVDAKRLLKSFHMIQQCNEKIKMYYIDWPLTLKMGEKVDPQLRNAVEVTENGSTVDLRKKIQLYKQLTDLTRHLLSVYLGIFTKDRAKTRDRLFDVLVHMDGLTSVSPAFLIRFVRAVRARDVNDIEKVRAELGDLVEGEHDIVPNLLGLLCDIFVSKWGGPGQNAGRSIAP